MLNFDIHNMASFWRLVIHGRENLLHASASEVCSPLHGARRVPGIHAFMHFFVHADVLNRLHHSRLFDMKKRTRCPYQGLALFN